MPWSNIVIYDSCYVLKLSGNGWEVFSVFRHIIFTRTSKLSNDGIIGVHRFLGSTFASQTDERRNEQTGRAQGDGIQIPCKYRLE